MAKQRIMISIDAESLAKIDELAEEHDMNRSQYLEWAGLQAHDTALTVRQRRAIARAIAEYVREGMAI